MQTLSQTARKQEARFSRMDSDEKKVVRAANWHIANDIANELAREGWVLKSIEPVECAARVTYYGPTYSGSNKWNWGMECACGDADATAYKRDAIAIARAHTNNVTIENKR